MVKKSTDGNHIFIQLGEDFILVKKGGYIHLNGWILAHGCQISNLGTRFSAQQGF